MKRIESLLLRFEQHYAIDINSGCWLWTGCLFKQGYGQFFDRATKRRLKAHRVSFELFKGPIPEGLDLDHLCRNRCCVNPDHLEPVTRKINVLRGVGVAAKWARRAHCAKGHLLEGANLTLETNRRRCLICKREIVRRASAKYNAKRRLQRLK